MTGKLKSTTGGDQDGTDQDQQLGPVFGFDQPRGNSFFLGGIGLGSDQGTGDPQDATDPQEELHRKRDALEEKIVALQDKSRDLIARKTFEAVQAADEEVVFAVYHHAEFWARPEVSGNHLQRLHLMKLVSPIEAFMNEVRRRNSQGRKLSDVARDFVKKHPGEAETLARSYVVDILASYPTDPRDAYKAIEILLSKGKPASDPREDASRRAAIGDVEGFFRAWVQVRGDADSLAKVAAEPEFLALVKEQLGDGVYAEVMADLRSSFHDDTQDHSTDGAFGKDLEPAFAAAVKSLKCLKNTIVWDSTVLDAAKAFQARMAPEIDKRSKGDAEAAKQLWQLASRMLADRYATFYGGDLAEDVVWGVQGDTEQQVLDLLHLPDPDTAPQDGAASGPSGPAAPSNALLDEEISTIARDHVAKLHAELEQSYLWAGDETVAGYLAGAHEAMKAKAKAANHDNPVQRADEGMVELRVTYDSYYKSLARLLRSCVQDEALQRTCLRLVGEGYDAGSEAVGGAKDAGGAEAAEAFRTSVHQTAEEVAGYWSYMLWPDAEGVLKTLRAFRKLYEGKASELSAAGVDWKQAVVLLKRAYSQVAGSLLDDLKKHLDAEKATEALQLIGVASAASSKSGLESEAAEGNGTDIAKRVFSLLENMSLIRDAPSDREAGARREKRLDFRDIADTIARQTKHLEPHSLSFLDIYESHVGMSLPRHIATRIEEPEEIEIFADSGFTIPAADTLAPNTGVELKSDDPELQFDLGKVSSGFSLGAAKARAAAIHDAKDDEVLMKDLVGMGFPEENRVVRVVFKRIYGFDPLFVIRQKKGFTGHADNAVFALEDAGRIDEVKTEVSQRIRANDNEAALMAVLKASKQERAALIDDAEILDLARKELSDEEYEQFHRCISGTLKLADLMRKHEGWGGSKETATKEAAAYVKQLKKEYEKDKVLGDKKLRARLQQDLFDPELEEILNEEFGPDTLLHIRQLLLAGGERNARQLMFEKLLEGKKGNDLLDALTSLEDADREALRTDASFVVKLTRQLQSFEYSRAMEILYAKKGAEVDYNLSKAQGKDEKELDAILALDADALREKASDPLWSKDVLRRFRGENRQLVEDLLEQARSSLGEQAIQNDLTLDQMGPVAQPDPPTPLLGPLDSGPDLFMGPMLPAPQITDTQVDREKKRRHLVLTHTIKVKASLSRSPREYIAAIQSVYHERGEVPEDPKKPKGATLQLFGRPERKEVLEGALPAIEKRWGKGHEYTQAAVDALQNDKDPADMALDLALETTFLHAFSDIKEEDVDAAIAKAGDHVLIHEWSNIMNEGPSGSSMKGLWEELQSKEAAAKKEKATPADKEAYQVALHRFAHFPLDCTADLKGRLARNQNWYFWQSTDKQLLRFKGAVRTRLQSVSPANIGQALGVPKEHDAHRMLNGETRQVVTEFAHQGELIDHKFSQGSAAEGFTDTDEQAMLSYVLYAGSVGAALERQDGQEVGEVSAEEKAGIDERLAEVGADMKEWEEARDAMAEAVKWGVILTIGAVGTALTGPGGPGIAAALATAFTTATATALVDEAFKGNDFDMSREGTKQIAKESLLAVVSVGGSKLTAHLGKSWGPAKKVMGWKEQWDKLAKQLDTDVEDIFGLGGKLTWNATKAGLNGGLDKVSAAALSVVDPNNLKYGISEGLAQGQDAVGAELEKAPAEFWQTFIAELAKSVGKEGKGRLLGGDKKSVPGTGDQMPENKGFGSLMDLGGRHADGLSDDLIDVAGDKIGDGTLLDEATWSPEGVGSLVWDLTKKRVSAEVDHQAGEAQKALWAPEMAARKDKVASLVGGDGEVDDEVLKARIALAQSLYEKAYEAEGGFDLTPAQWKALHWDEISSNLDKSLAGVDATADKEAVTAYQAWALGSPDGVGERSATSFEDFQKKVEKAEEDRQAMKDSKAYASLAPNQKAFFDAYVQDPTRLVGLAEVKPDDTLDIRTDSGLKNFQQAYGDTQQAMKEAVVSQLVQDWSFPRKVLAYRAIQSSSGDIADLELGKEVKGNIEAVQAFLDDKVPTDEELREKVGLGSSNTTATPTNAAAPTG